MLIKTISVYANGFYEWKSFCIDINEFAIIILLQESEKTMKQDIYSPKIDKKTMQKFFI